MGVTVSGEGLVSDSASEDGLSRREILRIVNRYIGVSGGYLGDFTYRTHSEFYAEYCDVDIDPFEYDGATTRERFIAILSSLSPTDQAKVLRDVLERFPPGDDEPVSRTEEARKEVLSLIRRLEGGPVVPGRHTRVTSEVVTRALADAEALLHAGPPSSAVDRVHTALHGYLIAACEDAGLTVPADASMTQLFKALRTGHSLEVAGTHSDFLNRIFNSLTNILDAMNPVRNRASLAHPNRVLLGEEEAQLVFNIVRTLLAYIDAKLAR